MFDPKTKILVVDDMSTMRKIVLRCLKECGFNDFVEAGDGDAAWTAIQGASPPIGLVISDWNMPNCSGLDLLKRVRADQTRAGLPFLLLTAESEAAQVTEALKAKVDAYIVKPFNTVVLRNKIQEVFNKLKGQSAA